MKQISDHIANCGQSEFDFKLNKLENLLSDWQRRQLYSENVSSRSPECSDGNIPSPTYSEPTDTDVSEYILSTGEELLEATSLISSESSNEEEFVDCDPVVDPNRSFPNIQVTSNGSVKDSPVSNLASKLKLNKVVHRRGRAKGTKKAFMDFSKSEKDKCKITHKSKANSDSKSQKKVKKNHKSSSCDSGC